MKTTDNDKVSLILIVTTIHLHIGFVRLIGERQKNHIN
jgi:hypothetical protein